MEKILTFDCYGTLLDTTPLFNFIGKVAQENGINPIKAQGTFTDLEDRLMYGENQFLPFNEILRETLKDCDFELKTNIFSSQYEQVIKVVQDFQPFEDVVPVLKKLKDDGYKLIIMSDTTHALAKYHQKNLNNLIDHFVTADDTKCYKPKLEFFNYASQKYNLDNAHHIHVAAGYWWDMVPCKILGWQKIWVNRHNLIGKDSEQPYQEISDLSELEKVLKTFSEIN